MYPLPIKAFGIKYLSVTLKIRKVDSNATLQSRRVELYGSASRYSGSRNVER